MMRAALWIAAALIAFGAAPARANDLPNIVVILADDLGTGDLGCYNPDSRVPTPRLDALAREGMRLTDAHSPSAVCTPTRYGLLTGRYAWRTRLKSGVLGGYSPCLLEPGRETLASLLAARGYDTMGVGKWHLGLGDAKQTDYSKPLRPGPLDFGFDGFFGIPASLDMTPYVFIDGDRPVEAPTGKVEGSKQRRAGGAGFWRAGPAAPSFRHDAVLPTLTDVAVRYVEERGESDSDAPFFLYFALSAPHTPWLPLEPFVGKSGAGAYGDFVVQVDDSIGRVLDALERGGMADTTLVIVTSDNGAHWTPGDIEKYEHRANYVYRGQKADVWEGGHRVPFIARWPGHVPAGATSGETVCLTDLFATLASVTGAEVAEGAGEDSFDALPVLLGEQPEDEPLREATVHHSLNGTFAIRQGRWKLIEGRGSGGFSKPRKVEPKAGEAAGQLYDMVADIAETRNLYLEQPKIVARLTALLERYRDQGFSRPVN